MVVGNPWKLSEKLVATVTSSALSTKPTGFREGSEDALIVLSYNLTTVSGVWTLSDQATKLQIADVLYLGVIPAAFKVEDLLITLSSAFTASVTCSIGFKYVDGVDSTPAQDAAYFIPAGQALSSTAIIRKTGIKAPPALTKAAYLTLTWAGAQDASNGVMDVVVIGRYSDTDLDRD